MSNRAPLHISLLAVVCALLLAACGGSASTPDAQHLTTAINTAPAVTAPTTVVDAATQPPVIATAPATTAAPANGTTDSVPTSPPTTQPAANAQGQVVLNLSVGSGQQQVGIEGSGTDVQGPRTFRIGSDGSIRVLDNLHKRLLFFTPEGKFSRAFAFAEAQSPVDFIVNNQGEIFVHDQGGNQVLRYAPNGKLVATIPVNSFVSSSADGIMLNANQDLLLTQGNQTFWPIIFGGEAVPAKFQQLTQQRGAVTPRSPAIFDVTNTSSGVTAMGVLALSAGVSGSKQQVATLPLSLPADSQFVNVDRAMNLYFASFGGEGADATVDVRRVLPDGSVAGGARLALAGCVASWRTVYVDQVGAAWTMCVSDTGVTVTHYLLLSPDDQVLPDAVNQAADTAWKPGPGFAAA